MYVCMYIHRGCTSAFFIIHFITARVCYMCSAALKSSKYNGLSL